MNIDNFENKDDNLEEKQKNDNNKEKANEHEKETTKSSNDIEDNKKDNDVKEDDKKRDNEDYDRLNEMKKMSDELKHKLRQTQKNNNNKPFKKINLKISLKGLLFLIFIISLIFYVPTIMRENRKQPIKEITYTEFTTKINNGIIKQVEEKQGLIYGYTDLKEDKNLTLDFDNNEKSEEVFKARMITDRLGDDVELLKTLKDKSIVIKSIPPEEISFWLSILMSWAPMILLLLLFFFITNKMNKGSGGPQIFNMGKSKAKENGEEISNVTFKDVAGIDEAKQELQEVVEFLREPEKFRAIGARIPKGVLLLGSPGTGKTLLAKAVAGEAKVPFFSMSGSEFVEMFVGVGASRVRDLFNKARKNAPCIVFIDEIDAVGRKRGTGQGGGNDEREQTLNQLLVEMDGFGTDETIIVLAATNRPDVLDRALRRPGRFDRQVTVDMPDKRGRKAILEVHARSKKIASDVDFEVIAKKTAGFAGADLANVLNEAAIIAARSEREEINMDDIEEASEKVVMGPEKKSKVVSEIDKKITAYHEAGHAVVNHIIGGETKVHKITIIPRGFAGGYTMPLPPEERMFYSKKRMLDEITDFFGGRVAEEIVFGKENITTGAGNDIERATAIATEMVTKYGMTDKFGPILLDGTQEGDMFQRKYYSEQTGKEVDDEVRRIITECYNRAKNILTENRNKLEAVTKTLLEKETIMGEEFEAIMNDENI